MFKLFIPLVVILLFALNVDNFAQRKYSSKKFNATKKFFAVSKYSHKPASFRTPSFKKPNLKLAQKYKFNSKVKRNYSAKLNFPKYRSYNKSTNSRYYSSGLRRY
jgi:hypothetical protein